VSNSVIYSAVPVICMLAMSDKLPDVVRLSRD
jgi:hypothetical protein